MQLVLIVRDGTARILQTKATFRRDGLVAGLTLNRTKSFSSRSIFYFHAFHTYFCLYRRVYGCLCFSINLFIEWKKKKSRRKYFCPATRPVSSSLHLLLMLVSFFSRFDRIRFTLFTSTAHHFTFLCTYIINMCTFISYECDIAGVKLNEA